MYKYRTIEERVSEILSKKERFTQSDIVSAQRIAKREQLEELKEVLIELCIVYNQRIKGEINYEQY